MGTNKNGKSKGIGDKAKMELLTNRIIDELKKGHIPWERPWTGYKGAWSRATGIKYSLMNQWFLPEGEYATKARILDEGGRINRDQYGHPYWVTGWAVDEKEVIDEETGEVKIERSRPHLRSWKVYNIELQTNLKVKYTEEEIMAINKESIPDLETLKAEYVKASGIKFNERKGNKAYYRPSTDTVVIPAKKQFKTIEEYYGTMFHEIAHSTGHKDRLNRLDGKASFGNEKYSREELIAELTSSAILANAGVETKKSFRNNVAYIESWLNALKNDTGMLVWASTRADKAYKFIINTLPEGVSIEKPKEQPKAEPKAKKVKAKKPEPKKDSLTKRQLQIVNGIMKNGHATKLGTQFLYTDDVTALITVNKAPVDGVYFEKNNETMKRVLKLIDSTMSTGKEVEVDIDDIVKFCKEHKITKPSNNPKYQYKVEETYFDPYKLRQFIQFIGTNKIMVDGRKPAVAWSANGNDGFGVLCPLRINK